jgi:ppGpp synthetase/RelA/SpoT-type nucleotidyltranferase
VKDRESLRRKLYSKLEAGRTITAQNFFDQVDDLAGVRVLTVYRPDFVAVHDFISRDQRWLVRKAEAFAWHPDDVDRLSKVGLTVRGPKVNGDLYTSVHYTVVQGSSTIACEIQVRSVHLEGWGEVDHRLRYPEKDPGPAATQMLRLLNNVTVLADSLAHAAREAGEEYWRHRDERRSYADLKKKLEALQGKLSAAEAREKAREASRLVDRLSSTAEASADRSWKLWNNVATHATTALQAHERDECAGGCGRKINLYSGRECPQCRCTYCASCWQEPSVYRSDHNQPGLCQRCIG